MTLKKDLEWSINKIQPLAETQIYSKIWPDAKVIPLDDDNQNILKNIIDVGGADKLLKWPNGTISFLAQRFRRYASYHREGYYQGRKTIFNYDDFTLREYRPKTNYKAECHKVLEALQENKFIAAYYAYGHVDKDEKGFRRFRIIDFITFANLWAQNKLKSYKREWNKDLSSYFLAWPFREIPRNCILWKAQNIRQLETLKTKRTLIFCPYCDCNFFTSKDLAHHSKVCYPYKEGLKLQIENGVT